MAYCNLAFWTANAHRLERGLFDGLFLADAVGVYDVYGGSPAAALRGTVQVPVNDPMMVIPAMALVTRHLGFGVTANLSYESPYLFARRISTLDHLTQGRTAWNIVTGYLDSAASAQGLERQRMHNDHDDLTDEFMQVVYGLREDSWADDAILAAREAGVYTAPDRIRALRHHGRQFNLNAVHLCEPSP
jgi:alkanesulfonate monooxygenase SsuD/methylene tetrahydromethanopterin reductase-like flavin-dependent oxidoreductase (luciferase family)